MTQVLLVSNRLPVRVVSSTECAARIEPSTGGLATGLRSTHERLGRVWIGWPGDLSRADEGVRREIEHELSERRLGPVHLAPDLVKRFYESFSNGVLWPLFHYLPYALPFDVADFDAYEEANERFAEVVARWWQEGDTVWVHDYQLLLLPQKIRDRCPGARIGFFLHIPFPSSEVFRTLPHREALLRGVLGADLIGFHTTAYLRHFASTALHLLGGRTDIDRVSYEGREIRLGVFPMGVDAQEIGATAADLAVESEVSDIRGDGSVRILLGIDRLDYTKGIPRRLLAFERMLERHPEHRESVRFVQVAVPSREDVSAYQAYRSQADELIGRIHGAFATPRWVPVHWLYRALSHEAVVALYRAADVMLVTPIRDGMNLVAKEFVAARTDGDGVLVLSEFAGAAAELAEAVHINPFDVEATAEAYHRALTMEPTERRRRMQALRRRVLSYDVHRWTADFLSTLASVEPSREIETRPSPPEKIAGVIRRIEDSDRVLLILDYDGTLVPLRRTPELAAPDHEILDLLHRLAATPGFEVHVLSGRSREVMEDWLGELPVGLHAEHGLWSRLAGGSWCSDLPNTASWYDRVLAMLEGFSARTQGSLVEKKSASLAWHWRAADAEFGAIQAKDLQLHLNSLLSNLPVEVLVGDRVIEVRPHGVHKGRVIDSLRSDAAGALFVALGDDRTDEDTFAALPEGAIAIHVGASPSRAGVRLADVPAARRLLRDLAGSTGRERDPKRRPGRRPG